MVTFTSGLMAAELSDEQVVERVLGGDTPSFEILMRRYNQRLYRVALSITRNDSEAEDIMQETYVRAYQHLGQFAGRAAFSTWLTRIAVHEALARVRRQARYQDVDVHPQSGGDPMSEIAAPAQSPEERAASGEVTRLLEDAVAGLPEPYRVVFVLRDVEELSTMETAQALEISEENVKIRLHRARALLRRAIFARAGATSAAAFQFHATRCDRVVRNVFAQIAEIEKR